MGSKVLPKVAGEGAVKSIAKGALREGGAGAVAGGLSLQETPEGKISAEKQLKRATGFGLFGAGIGGGLGAAGALKAAIQKSKFDPSFITEQVAPKVQQLFKEQLEKFSPSVQEFARNQLKIPAQAVNTIKNRGIETVRKIRRKFNDSTDPIFQKINQGITSVDDAAKQAFKSTINRVPQGSSFPADKTLNSMQGVLKNLNLVDKNGVLTPSSQNVTDPAVRGIIKQFGILQGKIRNVALKQTGKINKQQIMDKFSLQEKTEIANRLNTTVSDLVLTSKFSKIQIIESLNPKEISKLIGSNRNISKGDFDLLKLEMDSLFQESKANRRLVQQVRESMFDDAEKIAPGVKRARDLFRKSKEAEKRFSQSQFKEKKLDNFQKISKDELRELRELEEFTGVKFVDDVDALTSARLLDKVDDFAVAKFGDESKLIQKLKKAESKSDFAKIKREFVELFGESKDLDKIFADIRQFGTVQNAKSLGKRGALIAAPIRGFR